MAANVSGNIEMGAVILEGSTSNVNLSQSTINFVYAAEAYIQPIILVFGLFTNIASSVVLRKVRMNEVFRICLLSLSVVDALTCAIGFVQLVVEVSFYDGDIPQGTMEPAVITSNTLYFAYLMFMCASGSIVILIAVIRNFFVLRPMKARGCFTPRITKIVCFMAFFITFLLFAPVSLKIISQSCEDEVNHTVCDWMNSFDPTLHRVADIYVHYFISALYGPVIIIIYVVCVICIRVTIKKSVKTLSVLATRKTSASHTKDLTIITDARVRSRTAARITKTLLMILILDVICTLPYVIQGVGLLFAKGKSIFNEDGDAGRIYDVIVEIFLNLRPSYNFWLYVYQHPEFRVRVRSIVGRLCMPCFKSKCCPCCVLAQDPTTPLNSPLAWSLSTPGVHKGGAWFKRMSSTFQNGKDHYNVSPKSKGSGKISLNTRGTSRRNSHSMDSDSDWGNAGDMV